MLTRLPRVVLLDFTGELDGSSDVPAVQLKLGVEVLLGGDGGGVVGAGTLGHVTLAERAEEQRREQLSQKDAAGGGVCGAEALTPL